MSQKNEKNNNKYTHRIDSSKDDAIESHGIKRMRVGVGGVETLLGGGICWE